MTEQMIHRLPKRLKKVNDIIGTYSDGQQRLHKSHFATVTLLISAPL